MTAMRPETTSEHIARDMREGRFPERSEPQMVADLAAAISKRDGKNLWGHIHDLPPITGSGGADGG